VAGPPTFFFSNFCVLRYLPLDPFPLAGGWIFQDPVATYSGPFFFFFLLFSKFFLFCSGPCDVFPCRRTSPFLENPILPRSFLPPLQPRLTPYLFAVRGPLTSEPLDHSFPRRLPPSGRRTSPSFFSVHFELLGRLSCVLSNLRRSQNAYSSCHISSAGPIGTRSGAFLLHLSTGVFCNSSSQPPPAPRRASCSELSAGHVSFFPKSLRWGVGSVLWGKNPVVSGPAFPLPLHFNPRLFLMKGKCDDASYFSGPPSKSPIPKRETQASCDPPPFGGSAPLLPSSPPLDSPPLPTSHPEESLLVEEVSPSLRNPFLASSLFPNFLSKDSPPAPI